MQNSSGRTTRNSQKVQQFWLLELLYQQVLQDSLKPSVIFNRKGLENPTMEFEKHDENGGALAGTDGQTNQEDKEESGEQGAESPKHTQKATKTLKQHLISDSEQEDDNREGSPSPVKKPRLQLPLADTRGEKQNGLNPSQTRKRKHQNALSIPDELMIQPSDYHDCYAQPTPSYAEFLEYQKFVSLSQEHARKNRGRPAVIPATISKPPGGGGQGPPSLIEHEESEDEDEDVGHLSPGSGDQQVGDQQPSDPVLPAETSPATPAASGEVKGLKARFREEVEKQEADTMFGPPVQELLVKLVRKYVGANKKQANVDEIMKTHKLPSNMPFLQSPRIHHSIYAITEQKGRDIDREFRVMQGYTACGMAAIVKALESIMEKEDDIPELVEIGNLVVEGLRMLAYSSRDINLRRKDALRGYVDKKYGKLFAHSREISDEDLLGDNVDDLMKECEEDKRRQEKLTPQKSQKWANNRDSGNNKFVNRGKGSWERRQERRHSNDNAHPARGSGNHGYGNRGRGNGNRQGQNNNNHSQSGFGNPHNKPREHHQHGRNQNQRGRY